MTDKQRNYKDLKIIPQARAVEAANKKIKFFKDHPCPGLRSRWGKVNEAVGGHWRFSEIFYLAGASGSGKSYILNMLREDFVNPRLNSNYPNNYKILSFSFEMSAADEVIRTYTSKLETSYSDLVSHKMPDELYNKTLEVSKTVDNNMVYYVEDSGNAVQIWNTVKKFKERFPKHDLVITLDHTLLMEYLDESGEVELINKLSRLALKLKKRFGAMIILLGQLNDKIEQPNRIENITLHTPKKTDIHGGKSVFMAADNVIVIHRPERLGIKYYTNTKYPAKDLVAWHFLKGRLTGTEGIIRMKQAFYKGTLIYPYGSEEKLKQLELKEEYENEITKRKE